jgi:hypothetical protein
MKTRSLEILGRSQLPPAQAHAILEVMEMEIADLRAKFKTDTADLRAELHKVEGALSRWVLTCMLGQTAVLAGLGYFVLEHLRR